LLRVSPSSFLACIVAYPESSGCGMINTRFGVIGEENAIFSRELLEDDGEECPLVFVSKE
jgi:hypothetical protein